MLIGVLTAMGLAGRRVLRSRAERRRRDRIERALPGLAAQMGRTIRTGASLRTAIDDAASSDSGPLGDELGRVVDRCSRGVGLHAALDELRDRLDLPDVTLLVAACQLGHTEGGDLAAALDGVALTMVDRLEVADEARALASQARASTWVLVALPPLGAAAFALIDPEVARSMITTTAGRICLFVGAGLDAAGAWVSAWIVRRTIA